LDTTHSWIFKAQHAAERTSSLGTDGWASEPIKLSNIPSWYAGLQFETWPAGVEISQEKGRKPTKTPVAMFCCMHNDYSAVVEWAAGLLMLTSTASPKKQCR
jgi:hypothetical protein